MLPFSPGRQLGLRPFDILEIHLMTKKSIILRVAYQILLGRCLFIVVTIYIYRNLLGFYYFTTAFQTLKCEEHHYFTT
jgi:hypothetical protein